MESRKRVRRGTAPGRIASPPNAAAYPALANIAALIDHGGQITLGAMEPIRCVAIANEDFGCLAMLQRRPGETLPQLLDRLNTAIALAWTSEELIDEINAPVPKTKPR